MSPKSDAQNVLNSIRKIVQALRTSSRLAERDIGLSGAQLFVLQKLGEADHMSVNELAERTHTHQSSVSVVVQRLVEQKYVTRAQSKTDARRSELSLSTKGKNLLKKTPFTIQERLIEAIRAMPKKNQKQLGILLNQLVANAKLGYEPPPLFFEDSK